MASQIVPRSIFDIASDAETETSRMETCIELVNRTLQFSYEDAEQTERAQSQLFLLTELLGDIQERFATLTADTYALAAAEKAAA